jgi:hypothetical protein
MVRDARRRAPHYEGVRVRCAPKALFVVTDQADLPRPVLLAKIFRFALAPNQTYNCGHPALPQGAFRDRHGRKAGCGGL